MNFDYFRVYLERERRRENIELRPKVDGFCLRAYPKIFFRQGSASSGLHDLMTTEHEFVTLYIKQYVHLWF